MWFKKCCTSAKRCYEFKNGLEPSLGTPWATFYNLKKFDTFLVFSLQWLKNFKKKVLLQFLGKKKQLLVHGRRKKFGSLRVRVTNPNLFLQGW